MVWLSHGLLLSTHLILLDRLMHQRHGVKEIVRKTLVIQPVTLAIVPHVLFVAVIGTTVRRTYVLHTAASEAHRISFTASALVFQDRSPDPLNS